MGFLKTYEQVVSEVVSERLMRFIDENIFPLDDFMEDFISVVVERGYQLATVGEYNTSQELTAQQENRAIKMLINHKFPSPVHIIDDIGDTVWYHGVRVNHIHDFLYSTDFTGRQDEVQGTWITTDAAYASRYGDVFKLNVSDDIKIIKRQDCYATFKPYIDKVRKFREVIISDKNYDKNDKQLYYQLGDIETLFNNMTFQAIMGGYDAVLLDAEVMVVFNKDKLHVVNKPIK